MDGGAGDDYIYINYGEIYGKTHYIVNRGSGFDYIQVYSYGGSDAVSFGEGITPDDLSVQITDNGYYISDEGGGGYGGYGASTLLAVGIGNNEGMIISSESGGGMDVSDLNVRRFIFPTVRN